MSNSPNFSFPLMSPTQAGKEITYNQFVLAIDALLKAAGINGSASSLTLAELQSLFLSQAQLGALVAAELAKLPDPLTLAELNTALAGVSSGITLAQLQAELAKLPTSSGSCLTLAQLQTELANLPANQGGGITLAQLQAELNARPVPATVADVQAAVSGISSGGSGGITLAQLQAEIAKLTPSFSSGFTRIGVMNNSIDKTVLSGAFPSVVYSPATNKFYGLDYYRSFFEYDVASQTYKTLTPPPLSPAGYKTIAPTLCVLSNGNVMWAGAGQDTNVGKQACYIYDVNTKLWEAVPLGMASNIIGAKTFKPYDWEYTMVVGGTGQSLVVGHLFSETTKTSKLFAPSEFSSSYTLEGTDYSSSSGLQCCRLPSGKGLMVVPQYYTAFGASASFNITVIANTSVSPTTYSTSVAATLQRFPANSACMGMSSTSYGAVALVKSLATGTTRFYKYIEAQDAWFAMAEGLGTLSTSANAIAMATGPNDQALIVTESGSNPGLYLLNAAA